MASTAERGTWGSKAGFILAASGSAVGLGNIWGFPTRVGQGGGAVFVLVYLLCVLLICLPIMVAELVIGRHAQLAPVGSFDAIRPNTRWWLVGVLGVLAGAGILSFYSVIAGWSVAYIWFAATGALTGDTEAVGTFFGTFTANGPLTIGLTLVVLGATAAVLVGGVQSGIERVTKLMMPALIVLLLVLAMRAITLPGAAEGLAYYLKPDFSRLFDPTVINAALGQAFFSLSLGMGAMLTYGSYLGKRESIITAACWVVALDTAIALLAGFIIFPSCCSIEGFDPSASGPGLIFAVLPRLFATLPGGQLFGAAFFILLTMAALTSKHRNAKCSPRCAASRAHSSGRRAHSSALMNESSARLRSPVRDAASARTRLLFAMNSAIRTCAANDPTREPASRRRVKIVEQQRIGNQRRPAVPLP